MRKQTVFLSCLLILLVFGVLSYFSIQFFLIPGKTPTITAARVSVAKTKANTNRIAPAVNTDDQKRLENQTDYSPFKDLIETRAVEIPSPIQIDEFSIVYIWDENNLNVSFVLTNVMREKGPVKGYIIVAAVGVSSETDILESYPSESISDDREIEYMRGEPFSIRRFKIIKVVFQNEDVIHNIKYIFVFAYTETGNLLLKKRYRVTRG